ncbi:HepT-like ribonuclease domain-containing protein [Actinomyces sp. 565]|uniref:HepT-like ribonuclease domain-containing protein n=2 Tax=unclassified Actinomyces TaxID=2609248 RepID=UPI0013A6C3E1|nr:DUF86 domain-containing protein [Actinomyces sp. 594]NDR53826.1 DUF86 domain-containing protein [Actinomyces sp. 565]
MPRPDNLFLHEMRDAVSRIHQVIGNLSTEGIAADPLRTDALMWNYTVLGEAANKVSREFRNAHPEIVWHRPIGLRNRIIHGYWSIDIDVLVTTAERELQGRAGAGTL